MPKSIPERIRLMNGKMGGRLPLGAIRFTMLAAIFSMILGFTEPVPAVFASDDVSAVRESPGGAMDAAATGRLYYVSPKGSDAGPGTAARPWRTIGKAAGTVPPGSTVLVRAGVFRERVTITVSGSASGGVITFRNYPGEKAVLDGAGLAVPATENGMFFLENRSYITIQGFEIRNYRTAAREHVPVGIHVRGSCRNIRITGNRIHNIEHNGKFAEGADAHGIAVYGTSPTRAVKNLLIEGNELFALKLGSSEALVVNGNVDGFRIVKNRVHDNNNIGIDAVGFEGVSADSATDQARNGLIAENVIHNIDSYGNPAYGTDRSADGIYVDGGRNITIERNVVHHCNIGIELASEHRGKATGYVTVRDNFIYLNDVTGISLGGYDAGRGGARNCKVLNNTLFRNDRLFQGNGEICLQYDTRDNVIENNIFFANSQDLLLTNPFSQNTGNVVDHNFYYAPGGPASSRWQWKKELYTGFIAYRSETGNDAHSRFENPLPVSLTLPDLHLQAGSPAIDAGLNLEAAGPRDIDGQPRIVNTIDVGADEVR